MRDKQPVSKTLIADEERNIWLDDSGDEWIPIRACPSVRGSGWQPIETIAPNDKGKLDVLSWNNNQCDRWRIWHSGDIEKMIEHKVTHYLVIPKFPTQI